MYFQIRTILFWACLFFATSNYSQTIAMLYSKSIEVGLQGAGSETFFYGVYGKYTIPLSQKVHHFTAGFSLNVLNDFKGESTDESYLKNNIDMRIIPSLNFGYALNFKKWQFNLEIPVGANLAVTKGTLVNKKIGFERDFSNSEIFWYYGLLFLPKYKINNKNQIGLFLVFPLINDKAQSGYQVGIGWTTTLGMITKK